MTHEGVLTSKQQAEAIEMFLAFLKEEDIEGLPSDEQEIYINYLLVSLLEGELKALRDLEVL